MKITSNHSQCRYQLWLQMWYIATVNDRKWRYSDSLLCLARIPTSGSLLFISLCPLTCSGTIYCVWKDWYVDYWCSSESEQGLLSTKLNPFLLLSLSLSSLSPRINTFLFSLSLFSLSPRIEAPMYKTVTPSRPIRLVVKPEVTLSLAILESNVL